MSPLSMAYGTSSARGAYVPLGKFVSDGTTAGTTFTNIPQGYTDLMLVISAKATRAVINDHILIAPNTDTSSLYSYTYLNGETTGSGVTSARGATGSFAVAFNCCAGLYGATGVFATGVVHIPNYSNTSTFKTLISKCGMDLDGWGTQNIAANLYRSTNAITNLYAITYTNLIAGSTMTLYGVRSIGQ